MGEENNTLSPDFVKLFFNKPRKKGRPAFREKRQGHPGWQRNRGQHPLQGAQKKPASFDAGLF